MTAGRAAGPTTIIAVGMWLLVAVATVITPADPDLWGHVRFGQDILSSGQIVGADRYSFTSDRPWINHEWLAEVSFAALYGAAGPVGLLAFKTLATVAVMGLVWWHLRRQGGAPRVATLLLLVAFTGTHWRLSTVRPQVFSVLLFAVLLMLMADSDRRPRWRLWLVVPVLALWANLHGGWIVGLGALWVWAGLGLVDPGVGARGRLALAAVAAAAALATVANPWGIGLWEFLWQTVGFRRADIHEWQPLWFSFAVIIPWALAFAAGMLALWRGRGEEHAESRAAKVGVAIRWLRRLAVIGGLAGASILVSRLDAFFALSVVILLAPELIRALPQGPPHSSLLARYTFPGNGARAITFVATAIVVGYGLTILWPAARCIGMDGDWLPEQGAGRFIASHQLKGRMLTWFDWGEYAIWHFGPELQVSYDGRRETVYSDRMIQAHGRFYEAGDTARAFVETLRPDYIWIPNRLPIAKGLEADGWKPLFRGGTSSVFSRTEILPAPAAAPMSESRCFPDF